MTAHVTGTSTRKVDGSVKVLRCKSGVPNSTVSRFCQDTDREVASLRQRPPGLTASPNVFWDAIYVNARINHQIVSRAVMIAMDVFLAIGDARRGLQALVRKTVRGSGWQHCPDHLMRNILAHVPRGQAAMVGAFVCSTFAQPDANAARRQLCEVPTQSKCPLSKAADMPTGIEVHSRLREENPASWDKIPSTKPLARVSKDNKRITNIVGVLPNDDAVLRLPGAILAEQHDDWHWSDRHYLAVNNITTPNSTNP